ncbi:aminoacyl-histidine dipeptidase [Litoribacillus peritrichatus]|uniref:Aminoacyl-histidine dipeptidase n=1 Tax=Litoribacillus peritrichatus TaxID=718191 RepID=A0ABP7N150_9GAMM
MSISHLQPQRLWQYFSDICAIPHPSKHEAELIAYILAEAEKHGVDAETDELGNIRLSKPATKGYEHSVPVVLQSHMDMVPQKNAATNHDFLTDPIKPYVDGSWVTADGTTLGADNGIGMAAILAVMFNRDLEHGPLEALLTADEEAGMSGAFGLKPGWFEGKVLLNLDTEEEGELYVGCAGGVDVNVRWPVEYEAVPDVGYCAVSLSVTGLKGGHSGIDIHKGRGNANKLLCRTLLELSRHLELSVASIEGGSLRNAIPREAFSTLVIHESDRDQFNQILSDVIDDISDEYEAVESDLMIKSESVDLPEQVMVQEAFVGLLNAIVVCPNGVMRNSIKFDGVVETSSNFGVITSDDEVVSLLFMTRSLKNHARDNTVQRIRSCFEMVDAEVKAEGAYPGWTPSDEPKLLNLTKSVYKRLMGKEAGVQVIHAGLECGILGDIYPEWDMISFGPTITGAHSPDERVDIASVARFWDLLVAVLAKLAKSYE